MNRFQLKSKIILGSLFVALGLVAWVAAGSLTVHHQTHQEEHHQEGISPSKQSGISILLILFGGAVCEIVGLYLLVIPKPPSTKNSRKTLRSRATLAKQSSTLWSDR